jgi:PAS domain S-box-containing protein
MSFVSEGCRDLTGYTPTEIKNPEYPRYGDLIHPADQQRVWDTIQEAVEAGAPYVLEYRIRTKEDEERWVWERGRVIPQQDSASIYLEGFISDITERKLAEEDLRLFKAIVENSNEAIAISDPEGMLVYINEAHTTLFGRTLEEARQANYRDFYPPASIEILNHEVVPALERGESWEGELDAYDATGRRFPLWERADSIQDAEGNLRLAFGLMHDVSEQRDMELQREAMLEALRESEEKYRTLFEEALTPILLVDEGGHYVDANKAAFEFLECEREELLGQTVWDFSPPDRMEQQQQEHAPFVERRTLETDYWVRGAIKTLLLNVVPLEMDGQTILYGIGQDITARKRTEAQRKAALEAVRESEARYRTLFESANDAIFIMEGDTFIDCNDATVQIFGCEDKNDILNHTPAQFSPSTQPDGRDSGEKALAHIQAALNSKGQHFEWRHTRKDGTPFDSEVSLNRLQIDDTIYLQAIVRDITERKQAEAQRKAALEALRESEEKYRLLFESADVLVSVYDRDGICRLMNQKVASLFGGKPEDLIGRSFRELHPGAGDLYLQRIRHAIDTGHANEYEDRVTFPTGDRWLLTSVHPVPDAQGLLQTAQIVSQDITERKEAEEERIRLANQIREQARQMAHILATVPAGVLLLDPEGRIVEANPVAEDTLAVLTETETGGILTRLGDRTLDELLTSPPTRGLWHEVKAEAPLGDRTFEVIARPVENGPEPEQWVMVINEVTQEREIRAQLQRQEQLAAVGQLAAGIAHDFNNIMAVIVLYTQMGLRAPGLSRSVRERLKIIDQQAKRATDLIQQILDFGGRAILERRPMDLVPFLKETVRLLQRTIPEHVTVNLTFGLDKYTIDGDPTRMQQMLTNLAVNARDAMPNGGELRIELAKITVEPGHPPPVPEMKPGPWVKLTVSDTGVGMSEEVLLHLYEPFYTTKGPSEGTGLGLAQVHGIVNQHGGAIDVETEVGAGTTFTIYLPALETEAAEPAPQIAAPVSQGHGQRVLVVEDEPTVRAALVESLEAWHYQTMEAANGEEALAVLDAHANRVDVILSDVVMPAMGGIALFHAMRERGLSIPVVMLSGHPMESELKDLQAQGLAGWMLKPPDMKRLSRLLIQALQRDKSQ